MMISMAVSQPPRTLGAGCAATVVLRGGVGPEDDLWER